MPKLRQAVLRTLAVANGPKSTPEIAIALGYPTQTTRRALEDLAGHKVIERAKDTKADLCSLTLETTERLQQVPKTLPDEDFDE